MLINLCCYNLSNNEDPTNPEFNCAKGYIICHFIDSLLSFHDRPAFARFIGFISNAVAAMAAALIILDLSVNSRRPYKSLVIKKQSKVRGKLFKNNPWR